MDETVDPSSSVDPSSEDTSQAPVNPEDPTIIHMNPNDPLEASGAGTTFANAPGHAVRLGDPDKALPTFESEKVSTVETTIDMIPVPDRDLIDGVPDNFKSPVDTAPPTTTDPKIDTMPDGFITTPTTTVETTTTAVPMTTTVELPTTTLPTTTTTETTPPTTTIPPTPTQSPPTPTMQSTL